MDMVLDKVALEKPKSLAVLVIEAPVARTTYSQGIYTRKMTLGLIFWI